MCYSANASLGSLSISILGFLFLYYRNKPADRLVGMIIIGVSIMQIGEYLMHIDIDCKKGLNKTGSVIGMLSHSLIQPLFAFLAVMLFSKNKLNNQVTLLWIILIIVSLTSNIMYWPKTENLCSYKHECVDKSKGCQLYWPWFSSINVPLYITTVFVLPIIFSNIKNKAIWLTYIFMGPILLMYLYPKTASSIWCFLGPALTILLKIFIPQ
jgi:hypothetical protein